MNEVQYIKDFGLYADKLMKDYSSKVASTALANHRRRMWQLEIAMHRMEHELNLQLTQVLELAEYLPGADVAKLEARLGDMVRTTVREWTVRHLELMHNDNHIKKATVLG